MNVRNASVPPAIDDMCVIIRKGRDLTNYSSGFSVITPLRVYVGDDLNAIPMVSAPVGSGLAADAVFSLPLSFSAVELRVGTTGVTLHIVL